MMRCSSCTSITLFVLSITLKLAHPLETRKYAMPDTNPVHLRSKSARKGHRTSQMLLEVETEGKENTGQVRSMTYNVWNYNDGLYWDKRKDLIVWEIASKNYPEVICFNEIRVPLEDKEGGMFRDLHSLLAPKGYHGVYQEAMEYPDQDVAEGVAIFSRLPFDPKSVSAQHLHLSSQETDDTNRRVILHVPVSLPSGPTLHVLASHFSYARHEQKSNSRGVLSFLDTIKPESDPVILMGDFNVLNDGEAPMQLLESGGFVDAWKATREYKGVGGDTFCNCKIKMENKDRCSHSGRIDRIFAMNLSAESAELGSQGLKHVEGLERPLCPSDHRAVVATFKYQLTE